METQTQTPTKWYDRKWLVVLLCIIFFPVGLYALWKNRDIHIGWKLGYTAFIAFLIFLPKSEKADKPATTETAAIADVPKKVELTQQQRDSIARVEKLAAIEERKAQTITAEDLTAAFDENELRAENNYKGKSFYVEGTVESINTMLGDVMVMLEGHDYVSSVVCTMADKQQAAQLDKGMRLTFYGKCDGMSLMKGVSLRNAKAVPGIWQLEEELAKLP